MKNKLIDKKTGAHIAIDYIRVVRSDFDVVDGKTGKKLAKDIQVLPLCYSSIEELCADFEDYKPTEPLIKDEKIRKAVRAWAEAESEDCYYGENATTLYNGSGDHIEFWSRPFKDLKPYEHYTIAELCGEEE